MSRAIASSSRIAVLAATAAISCLSASFAQSRPPSPQEILRLPPAAQVVVPPAGDDVCTLSPAWPLGTGETASTLVGSLTAEGITAFSPAELQHEWQPLVGQKVSAEALTRLVERVACRYRERGFIFARASLVQGDTAGHYRLIVSEGRLARLEVAVEDENAAAFLKRAFAGVREGHPINANDVRRGLVLARTYGLSDVRPTVRRSRHEPGALDLVIVAKVPPTRFFFATDNFGSRQIGRWGALMGLEFSGLTPLYERTSIGLYRTLESAEQTTAQISSRALLSDIGLGGSIDLAYSHALPRAELAPLEIASDTFFGRAGLDYPVWVQRGLIVSAKLSLDYLDQNTDLLGGTPFVSDHMRVLSLGIDAAGLSPIGSWTANTELRQGVPLFAASKKGDALLSRPEGNPNALVWRGTASLTHQFDYVTASLTLRGQYSANQLLSFEQFTIGTLNGGRGYDPAAFTGDRGIGGSLDLSGPSFTLTQLGIPESVRFAPIAFLDAGRLWDAGGSGAKNGLSGGGGFAIGLTRGTALQVVYAQPFAVNRAMKSSYGSRFLLRLTASVDGPFQQLSDLFGNGEATP